MGMIVLESVSSNGDSTDLCVNWGHSWQSKTPTALSVLFVSNTKVSDFHSPLGDLSRLYQRRAQPDLDSEAIFSGRTL
jgi:hypothetical protein